jgi:hypothetical protein
MRRVPVTVDPPTIPGLRSLGPITGTLRFVPEVAIKSVSFRGNIATSIQNRFQHVHIEAAADVLPDQSPREVLDFLQEFVARELKRARDGETAPPVPRSSRFADRLS